MGEASSPYAAPARHTTALTFIVRDTPESAERTAALICHQQHATTTGYLSTVPKEACRQAAAAATLLVTEPDPDRICTDIFGGPQTADVRGLVNGQWIETVSDVCKVPAQAVWVTFSEIPPPDWYVAGKPGEPMKK